MNRQYYCEIKDDAHKTQILKKLEEIGEPVDYDIIRESYNVNDDTRGYINFQDRPIESNRQVWALDCKKEYSNINAIEELEENIKFIDELIEKF